MKAVKTHQTLDTSSIDILNRVVESDCLLIYTNFSRFRD